MASPAKFRHHRLSDFLSVFFIAVLSMDCCHSTGEVSSAVMANAHNLLRLLGGLSAALFTENKPNPSRKNLWLSLANGAGTYANSLRRALFSRYSVP
jgi:hypothetical protein